MKLRWSQINWTEAEEQVSRLQIRIVKATLEQKMEVSQKTPVFNDEFVLCQSNSC